MSPFWRSMRLVGFVLFAGMAIALLAGVVLLPAYASAANVFYERDLQQAKLADMHDLREANRQLIEAAEKKDPVLIERLAMRQLRYKPRENEVAVAVNSPSQTSLITFTRHPRPALPEGWCIGMAGKLENVNTRRGLLALAGALLLIAVVAFATPQPPEEPAAETKAPKGK